MTTCLHEACWVLCTVAFMYPRLRQFIQYPALDVGCGIGDFLSFDQKIMGLDINPKLVAYATSKGMSAKHMPVDELPVKSNSINFVNLDNVLEHISNPEALLTEIARVLTAGGGFLSVFRASRVMRLTLIIKFFMMRFY